jgi:transcriptional regulator, cro/CI family
LYHLGTFLVKRKVLFKNKGDDMTSFSERLKELRKKNSLTQQELADKVGTNRVNVTKWETGRTEPTLENIVKLSKILDTTTDELLGKNINFGDTILNKKYKYDLSVLKESDIQNLYDLKITLAFDLLDESLNPTKLKEILMEKNKLNKEEESILDTILAEAKEFADDVNEFYKFKKSNKKFKWPWQKNNNNLTTKDSNNIK